MTVRVHNSLIQLGNDHGITVHTQQLKYGFIRFMFVFEDEPQMEEIAKILRKRRSLHVTEKKYRHGLFMGYVYVMTKKDHAAMECRLTTEHKASEEWWERFHGADPETRRLMACGIIP